MPQALPAIVTPDTSADMISCATVSELSMVRARTATTAEAEPETDYAIRCDGKTLAIDCKKGGAYTIVFASYDTSGKMTTVKTLTAELNAGVNSDVKIPEDVTLEAGDKIFLWENLKTLRPLCDAFTINK